MRTENDPNSLLLSTQAPKIKLIGFQSTFVHIQAKLGQDNLLRLVRWHCPPDTFFEIQTLEVWGRALYFSVTEAPHNTEVYKWMGKKHSSFFQTAETSKRAPNSGVKGSGANHYPRAPAHTGTWNGWVINLISLYEEMSEIKFITSGACGFPQCGLCHNISSIMWYIYNYDFDRLIKLTLFINLFTLNKLTGRGP